MDSTEAFIKMDEALHEFNKLKYMVQTQRIDEIPRQSEIVDGLLWEVREVYSRSCNWEPEFRTIVKKYVDITDIRVN